MENKRILFWFRRDLRLHDNHALCRALQVGLPVLPLFIFDADILSKIENKTDARVDFIYRRLEELNKQLRLYNSSILVEVGKPLDVFKRLVKSYTLTQVFLNEDYEPSALQRDENVAQFLKSQGIGFHSLKDHVVFARNELIKPDGTPYKVFTPYAKKWKHKLNDECVPYFPSENHLKNLHREFFSIPSLLSIGFEESNIKIPSFAIGKSILVNYKTNRNFPSLDASTKVGPHLRFGTISIRELVKEAVKHKAETYLNELIWREFFSQILYHFPQVEKSPFKPAYQFIPWLNNENDFIRWKNGTTGYPMVDAGMRQLKATGFMHNRVRMVAAGFLIKHLLIDYRWGEAFWAQQLLDYDLASNNGNWQWAAGCGCDSAPYFRVFNPEIQLKKFDPTLSYIKKWIPEWGSQKYPAPMINHASARLRAIRVYKNALSAYQ